MSNSLWSHKLQHARLPCTSLSPRIAQTHIHWFGNAIQQSYLQMPPSLTLTLSQHQVFSNELPLRIRRPKYWSFSFNICPSVNIQSWFPLGLTGLISLLSKRLSRVFSSTTIWKHQFFGTQPSLWSNFHIRTWLLEKPQLWLKGTLSAK